MEVWDNDAEHIIGKLHDFVDKYSLSFKNGADVGKDRATSHSHTFRGRRSHMEVTLKVFCDVNYLIPDCQSYCAPRNNTDGHFTCDYAAGVKLCLDGWYDPGTDCVKKKKFCVPLNSTLGHYECNPVSGEKICLPGWDGANCTERKRTLRMICVCIDRQYTVLIYRRNTDRDRGRKNEILHLSHWPISKLGFPNTSYF